MSFKAYRPQSIAKAAPVAADDGRQAEAVKQGSTALPTEDDLPGFMSDAEKPLDASRLRFGWRPPRK